MLPTPSNIKYANRLIVEICDRIKAGTFSMAEYFPEEMTSVIVPAPKEEPAQEPVEQAPVEPPPVKSAEASTPKRREKKAPELTIEGWPTQWLGMTRIETSTRIGYDAAVKFWIRASYDDRNRRLGTLSLASLKLSDVLTAIASRRELSGKTINNYVSVLRLALSVAVADKLMSTNVAEAVTRAKHQRQATDPFSREESEAIIAEAAAVDPQIHNYIEFWFWSGLRTSEINGLSGVMSTFATTPSRSSACWWPGKRRTAPRRRRRAWCASIAGRTRR
ncbi:Arm DNA-binding domain-containing protein [Candidatus Burkholderia verschuerenii]|uniref:Arm DNA-binding domain-containing protein n=1 Tax=Candidatus Burkholderia verschuerenii TaxID=242163 RepID=UPI0009F8E660|nr:DUF3596 domain-containing protein [Candidatus Burkholderia verschuerenii]